MTSALLEKIEEQIERSLHLIDRMPEIPAEWVPAIPGARPVGWLLGHLLDCLAGFCAVLQAAEPAGLGHFSNLRALPVNHLCRQVEARDRIATYRAHIQEGFALLFDSDLSRRLPTVFVPQGEVILTLLLGNLEHLVSHKYQLFVYLKMAGVDVGTPDLYRFRNV